MTTAQIGIMLHSRLMDESRPLEAIEKEKQNQDVHSFVESN